MLRIHEATRDVVVFIPMNGIDRTRPAHPFSEDRIARTAAVFEVLLLELRVGQRRDYLRPNHILMLLTLQLLLRRR